MCRCGKASSERECQLSDPVIGMKQCSASIEVLEQKGNEFAM
jgi:hypothetical protein